MFRKKAIDDATEVVRQSIIANKSNKHCIRDYSGSIFELTADMMVKDRTFNKKEAKELSGIAEGILQKYARLLSIH